MNESFIDIPREYTAIAEWLFTLLFIMVLPKRFKGLKLYAWIFLWLAIFWGYQTLAGILPLYLWIPGMIGAFLLTWAFLFLSVKVDSRTSVYFGVQAFIMAEFAASIEWQIFFFHIETRGYSLIANLLYLFSIYSLVFLLILALEHRYKKVTNRMIITKSDILTALVTGVAVFGLSNLSFTGIQSPFTGRYPIEIFYIRSLVDFVGIVLFFAIREHKVFMLSQVELVVINNLLEKQQQQYTISQESIKVINQKYHDMKYQINLIKNEMDGGKRAEYIHQMEEGIKIYETQFKTGYEVLDTILQSKGFQCTDHQITLNVVAAGELLRFISVIDLVSFFGNMLDNAIESCTQLDDIDKRLINLTVSRQKDMILIRCENYYENVLKYNDGILTTTKENAIYHGYGIRSISAIIDRYQGTMRITTDNNWFKIICLLPIGNPSK